ncbi:hypothetical protein ACHAXR_007592 [Thalassiosira sp. AJA248-18]
MTKQKSKTKKAAGSRPYNRYNLFFILERENLILIKGGTTKWTTATADARESQPIIKEGYENMNLPPLPPRFACLAGFIPEGWCIHGGPQKRRPHRKTHGVASFRELAQEIARSWKTIDKETLDWCAAVEKILKQRHNALKEKGKTSTNVARTTSSTQSKSPVAIAPNQVEQTQEQGLSIDLKTCPPLETHVDKVPSSLVRASPAAIEDFGSQAANGEFSWGPSEDTVAIISSIVFGEVTSQSTDTICSSSSMTSSMTSIQAEEEPTLSMPLSNASIQSDPFFCSDLELTDYNFDIRPPMSSYCPTKDDDLANISDAEIRKMWLTDC